jgi:hypothetical protein
MENDSPTSDTPKPATRDPLIRYSVFAALGCAAVCMIFTLLYVFSYSLDSTISFERHFDAYLASSNSGNLSTVLGLHMAQNRMFLQSCGMVAGIFFACVGLALFLVGIQSTVDANGQLKDYSTNIRRLVPGGLILLASMIFVGVSAMNPIDFQLGPVPPAPTAAAAPSSPTEAAPTEATPAPPQTLSPTGNPPSTQSQLQPAPPVRLTPQSATNTAPLQPTPVSQQTPTQHPANRPTLVRVSRRTAAQQRAAEHRFQP